ncbi:MAG: alpha/beta fold hydrolase [Phycisphaeraceae bacterium]|nr:MAG: alpha/beta fold hydrolase [Phycisphaeraceae bacterium]
MDARTKAAGFTQARRCLARLLALGLIGYGVWCTMLFSMQDRMLFPREFAEATGAPTNAERLAITIESSPGRGGEVEAFLSLPQGEGPFPLVVAFHGNAECVDGLDWYRERYTGRAWAVLTPEYRGYGRSSGKPSQKAIVADAVQFIDLLLNRPEIDASRIVYHGRSLGGAVAAQVARERPPRAMILESTFTSIASMAAGYGVPPFLVKNPFRTDRVLREYTGPVLLLHGIDDTIIPIEHSRRLAKRAPQRGANATHAPATRTLIEMPGGHNDFPVDEAAYWKAIDGFLDSMK